MPRIRRPIRANARGLLAVCVAVLSFLAVASVGAADPTSATNLLQNGSLEQASGVTPSCWLLGGYGTNTYQWSRSSDVYDGASAEQLTISSLSSGDGKLLSGV